MDIMKALTIEDREKIKDYIRLNASSDSGKIIDKDIDLDHILRFWSKNKENLFEKFGEELIISRNIEFKESDSEIIERMYTVLNNNESFIDNLYQCYRIDWKKKTYDEKEDLFYLQRTVFDPVSLAENRIRTSEKRKILLKEEGKYISISQGDKPVRIIGKLAESWGIEGFEQLRTEHSMCLNTKKLSGNLNISIHPLDYMTMSDNNSKWTSCMGWGHKGEYRQGTVEMMNSSNVVVAYLTASTPYSFGRHEWNNKKWRCLFIVDNDIIVAIKQYPYYNRNLVNEALKIVGNINNFNNPRIETFNDDDISNLSFSTGAMYNDMECGYNHQIIINGDSEYSLNNDMTHKEIYYSGPSECMICGDCYDDYWTEEYETSDLVCLKCEERPVCSICGKIIRRGEDNIVYEGEIVCEDCVNDEFTWDRLAQRYIKNNDAIELRLYRDNKRSSMYSFDTDKNILNPDDYEIKISNYLNDGYKIIQANTIERYKDKFEDYVYFVYIEDCTEKMLNEFGLYGKEDKEKYINNQMFWDTVSW